jgi:signal peptidase II
MFNLAMGKWATLFGGGAVVFAVDQWLKNGASRLSEADFNFNWIKLSRYENYGISFGINLPQALMLGAIVLFLLMLMGLFFFSKTKNIIYYLGIILSFGGGLGNLFDRLKFGFVRDFISIGNFPIFNLADICIVGGIILVVISMWLINEQKQKI